MTSLERAEIRRLPKKYRPLGAWGYFWYSVLFAIPVVGLIALIVCSVRDKNICLRGYARSYWCAIIVSLIFTLVAAGVIAILVATNVIPPEYVQQIMDSLTATK